MGPRRGQCPVCRFRFRLRRDGTLQSHHLYCGAERQPECEGSGKPPRCSGDEPRTVYTHDADGAIIAVDARKNAP